MLFLKHHKSSAQCKKTKQKEAPRDIKQISHTLGKSEEKRSHMNVERPLKKWLVLWPSARLTLWRVFVGYVYIAHLVHSLKRVLELVSEDLLLLPPLTTKHGLSFSLSLINYDILNEASQNDVTWSFKWHLWRRVKRSHEVCDSMKWVSKSDPLPIEYAIIFKRLESLVDVEYHRNVHSSGHGMHVYWSLCLVKTKLLRLRCLGVHIECVLPRHNLFEWLGWKKSVKITKGGIRSVFYNSLLSFQIAIGLFQFSIKIPQTSWGSH